LVKKKKTNKELGFTWWRHALKCKQSEDDF